MQTKGKGQALFPFVFFGAVILKLRTFVVGIIFNRHAALSHPMVYGDGIFICEAGSSD